MFAFPSADAQKGGGFFIFLKTMIVFRTIIRFEGSKSQTDIHSTKQAAVVTSLKHKTNPNIISIEIHKTKITLKGEQTLEEVYHWDNPNC